MSKLITTTQTIGPFPHEGWRWAFESASAAGEIIIHGQVLDGDGQPISDAILEAWQPGANGGPAVGLPGLYRVPSGDEGEFRFALPRRRVSIRARKKQFRRSTRRRLRRRSSSRS